MYLMMNFSILMRRFDYDNVASYKTIEKLGAKFIEEVCPPKDYIYYYEGMPKQRIYEVRSDGNSRDNE